eukprot:14652464-Alexandrium_andersonii.AAC.1
MLVHLEIEDVRIAVIVAHAPHDKSPANQRKSFWETMRRLLQYVQCKQYVPILLCDANAKLGSEVSTSA